MFYLFEVEDKAIFDEVIEIFIEAEDEYAAEFKFQELFPMDCYRGWLIDEYTKEEAEVLGFDIF